MVNIIKPKERALFLLGILFTGFALLQLGLVRNNLSLTTFIPLIVFAGCSGVSVYVLHLRRQPGDPVLLALIYFLSGLGLALIARLAPNFLTRQLIWLVVATDITLGRGYPAQRFKLAPKL